MTGGTVIIFTAVIVAAFVHISIGRRRVKTENKVHQNKGPYHNKTIIVRLRTGECKVHETVTKESWIENCDQSRNDYPQHFYSFLYGCYYVDGENYYKVWPGYCEFGLRRAVIIENNCLRAQFGKAKVAKTSRSVIRCRTAYTANSTVAQTQYFALEYFGKFNQHEQLCIKRIHSTSDTYEQPMLITCNEFSAEKWPKGECLRFSYTTMGGQYSFDTECNKIENKAPNDEDKKQIGDRVFDDYKNPRHSKTVVVQQDEYNERCTVYDQLRNDVRYKEECRKLEKELPMYFKITRTSKCVFVRYQTDFEAWPGYCEIGNYRVAYDGRKCENFSVVPRSIERVQRPKFNKCKEEYTYDARRNVEKYHTLELAGMLNKDYVCLFIAKRNLKLVICNNMIKSDQDKVENWAPKMCHAFYTSTTGDRRTVKGNCKDLQTIIWYSSGNPSPAYVERKLREKKFI